LRHDYIGTEHLLLGLLRDQETLAARVLSSLDVSLAEVRAQVVLIIGQGDDSATGQIPFTTRAKKVLELSLREAQRIGDNYIETEHLLLGLVREKEGVANRKAKPYRPASPPLSIEVGDELQRLRDNMEAAIEAQAFDRAAELRERERLLTRLSRELEAVWEGRSKMVEQPLFAPPGRATIRAVGRGSFARSTAAGTLDYDTAGRPSLAPAVWFALGALVLGAGLWIGWLIWG
jgi:ATP-dependent Clp protease ATP-binding subunit ClpA